MYPEIRVAALYCQVDSENGMPVTVQLPERRRFDYMPAARTILDIPMFRYVTASPTFSRITKMEWLEKWRLNISMLVVFCALVRNTHPSE